MAEEKHRPEICESEQRLSIQPSEKIDTIVNELTSSCIKDDCFNNVDLPPLPSMEALIGIIRKVRDIIFP